MPVGLTDVVAIAAGVIHFVALDSDGTVTVWGYNDRGQTDVPAGLTDVVAIAAGFHHSLALGSDGTVTAWGWDEFGQTDVPAGLTDVVAIAAGGVHSLALLSDGTVTGWGWDFYGQAAPPAPLAGVVAIAAGGYFSLALGSDGTVTAWGNSEQGQATVPAGVAGAVAIAAGEYHSLAILAAQGPADGTAPVVVLTCPAAEVLLGSTSEATWTAYDPMPGSGIAGGSPSSGFVALNTSSVGPKTATVPAGTVLDDEGNTSEEVACGYSVVYHFDGFFRPVDKGGVVNSFKAGSAVPIKFSLDSDQGLDILAIGSPSLTFTPCTAGASVDAIEETVTAGGSSLAYDAVAGQYVYVWKTLKTWAGKCGTFQLTLDDGTSHTAKFLFTK
ncbi:PxKF domain-containing protein [Microbacterium sp. DT81.1]|uniref:PxKF domain-containing protein n=1 Tax=Microbacterium sp. DT81.1 TaxID=3393413 RepID=UPI003CF2A042